MATYFNGVFYPDGKDLGEQPKIASQIASFNIEQARSRHDMEIIQPWLPNGKPNPEFAKYYPENAKEYGMEKLL